MTEGQAEVTEPTTPSAPAAAPAAAAPATPPVDVEAIKAEVAKTVSETVKADLPDINGAVKEAVQGVFSQLAGGPKKEDNIFHKEFLENPEGFAKAIKDAAVEQATYDIKSAQATTKQHQSVLQEWEQKVPGISKYNFEVSGRYNNIKATNAGISEKEALAQALSATAEDLGLEVLSEDDVRQQAALAPSMGGTGASAAVKQQGDAQEFLKSLQSRGRALRSPTKKE